jgi:hypothetical protein
MTQQDLDKTIELICLRSQGEKMLVGDIMNAMEIDGAFLDLLFDEGCLLRQDKSKQELSRRVKLLRVFLVD